MEISDFFFYIYLFLVKKKIIVLLLLQIYIYSVGLSTGARVECAVEGKYIYYNIITTAANI